MAMSRRQVAMSSMASGAPALLAACQSASGPSYEDAARELWRLPAFDLGDAGALQRALVRCATLAPSSHNTQCWKFRLDAARAITILPDFTRRCPVVDPDDHHLFVSLGCAAENLAQAAVAHGLQAEPLFDAVRNELRVALQPTAVVSSSPLVKAIPQRQSTRAEYDGRPLAAEELRRLEQTAAGSGVKLLLPTERQALERLLEFVVQGNTTQLNDRAFVDELKAWLRFNGADAVRSGDGLYGPSSGNPSLPSWLGPRLFDFVVTAEGENDKVAKQVRSSAGIAVFVGPREDRAGWIETGRVYERFALQATALGIRTAHLNQPVEVASLRPAFARSLGLPGERPDLVIRFGRGPTMPPSLRRPLPAVLV
jgi:hypothetical protein